ncbi:hypothetical protein Q3O59_06900 [Alkalimonas delamerensis]|uniref:Uncharacterized protein n=1 Tax=Alkalimonas delamerensis TaxID=265981 RepID=A0ABT9GPC9_9GAMM|nr:hypothetical protein [Alkalimonas delamerensis]MDP4528759.1 hypothetical protein [Alkalimonas delamerensis]
MSEYLEFEQLSEIDDLLKLRVKGESSGFAGTADCYVNEDQFQSFCSQLVGFPKNREDSIRFCSGENDQLSHFDIEFSCIDSSGRILTVIQIVSRDTRYPNERLCYVASFSFKLEPAAFDRFVKGLSRVSVINNVGSKSALVNET